MNKKIKQLSSLEKFDYNSYQRLLKKTWITLLEQNVPMGYALVDGQHLAWKNTKEEERVNQPLLYTGPLTKWKMELNGHADLQLQDYSYGDCRVVQEGSIIKVYVLPVKGKLTNEKYLKPLNKIFRKFKPKMVVEVVSDWSVLESTETVNPAQIIGDKLQQLHTAFLALKAANKDVDYATQMKQQELLHKLEQVCLKWQQEIEPISATVVQDKQTKQWQKLYRKWMKQLERRQAIAAKQNETPIGKAYEAIKPILKYYQWTKGKYEDWNHSIRNVLKPTAENKQLIEQAIKIPQSSIEQFTVLYDTAKGKDKKTYRAANKISERLLKEYVLCHQAVEDWRRLAEQIAAVELKKDVIFQEYMASDVSLSESDLKMVDAEKAKKIKQLINAFTDFRATEVAAIPAFYPRYKKSLQVNFCDNYTKSLNYALGRTAEKLEDPRVQPPAHPSHNFVLKTIEGKVFQPPSGTPTVGKAILIEDDDALQGSLGDCYLISSMIGLAKKYPDVIRNAIVERKVAGQTYYDVQLFFVDPKDKKKMVQQTVTIDNQFMTKADGSSSYAHRGDQGELWPLIIEKAMAKAVGGYEPLTGGEVAWTLRMLTGKMPNKVDVRNEDGKGDGAKKATTTAEIVKLLTENKGKLMTVSIGKPKKDTSYFTVLPTKPGGTESFYVSYKSQVIFCNHAYVLEAVDETKLATAGVNDQVITLRNPHKNSDPAYKFPAMSPQFLAKCATNITVL